MPKLTLGMSYADALEATRGLDLKTYRRHNCTRSHRTTRTFLLCAFPRAAWVVGTGDIALIAWCGVPTITLHPDIESAEKSQRFIDDVGCGGKCNDRHEIVRIER